MNEKHLAKNRSWRDRRSARTRMSAVNGPLPVVDVILILEGTYPFVLGGVSNWAHGLIHGMPDLTFGLLFLGAKYEHRQVKYALPSNVRFLLEIDIYEYMPRDFQKPRVSPRSRRQKAISAVEQLCFDLQDGHMASFDRVYESLSVPILSIGDLAYSRLGWTLLNAIYTAKARTMAFVDFFWTWHYAYLPVLNLFYAEIPPARLYHTICTGWAGCLGVIARKRFGVPLLLTEHGIYLNERRVEISQIDWKNNNGEDHEIVIPSGANYFKDMWNNLFNAMTRLCYDRCDALDFREEADVKVFYLNAETENEIGLAYAFEKERIDAIARNLRIIGDSEISMITLYGKWRF